MIPNSSLVTSETGKYIGQPASHPFPSTSSTTPNHNLSRPSSSNYVDVPNSFELSPLTTAENIAKSSAASIRSSCISVRSSGSGSVANSAGRRRILGGGIMNIGACEIGTPTSSAAAKRRSKSSARSVRFDSSVVGGMSRCSGSAASPVVTSPRLSRFSAVGSTVDENEKDGDVSGYYSDSAVGIDVKGVVSSRVCHGALRDALDSCLVGTASRG
ncbi:unnamed protein product [Ambrosiozyma monospora]|uniref:Unnamed protein product n=1 Tax=Ambrosiozyma monospora TaxID=43982 RepID=A0ACB5T755_AMBMO|nr:unnamed protein product [Ambrosiozyma monospora]